MHDDKAGSRTTPGERYLDIAWLRANGRRKSRSTLFPPPPRELTKVEREELTSIIDSAIAAERDRCIARIKHWFGGDSIDDDGYGCVREIENGV